MTYNEARAIADESKTTPYPDCIKAYWILHDHPRWAHVPKVDDEVDEEYVREFLWEVANGPRGY
jgi:hypothetical protein